MGTIETITYLAPCPDNCGRIIEWTETYSWRFAAYGGEYEFDSERIRNAAPTYDVPCECQEREE